MTDLVLSKIDGAARLLAEARTVQDAKQIADVAEAARVYAKRVEASIITVNYAAEIKIRAERLLGEILEETPMNTGSRRLPKGSASTSAAPKLETFGISHKQSHRSQKLASIPSPQFEQTLSEQKSSGKEITTAAFMRVIEPKPDRSCTTQQCQWRRGFLFRADVAMANAKYEDWSQFKIDSRIVSAAKRTANSWKKLAEYLEELLDEQNEKTRAA